MVTCSATSVMRAAYTRDGAKSGRPELVRPIAESLAQLEHFDAQISELSTSQAGRVITPKRIVVAGGTVLAALLMLLIVHGLNPGSAHVQGSASKPMPGKKAESTTSAKTDVGSESTNVEVGSVQDMGDALYAHLPYRKISEAVAIDGVRLSKEFCPDGNKKYRKVGHDPRRATMSKAEIDQMTSFGGRFIDPVYESVITAQYAVTPGEPKFIF